MSVAAAGVVDDTTRHKMETPRCGVRDPPATNNSAEALSKINLCRYLLRLLTLNTTA